MRSRTNILLCLQFLLAATAAPAQTAPGPRRAMDQFDVPGGVIVSSTSRTLPMVDEPAEEVDLETYTGVVRLIDHANAVAIRYHAADGKERDPASFMDEDNVLEREIRAIFRMLNSFRTGSLGIALKSEMNRALLAENMSVATDMLWVFGLMPNRTAPYEGKLFRLCERYDVPPYTAPNEPGTFVRKQALLDAGLAEMNANFAQLKSGIKLRK